MCLGRGLRVVGSSHLARITASLEEAGADHAVSDLSRVRGFTLGLTQQWGVQALQQLGVVDLEGQEEIKEREMWVRPGRDGNPVLNPEGGQERPPRSDGFQLPESSLQTPP